jgi:hypothetical protein
MASELGSLHQKEKNTVKHRELSRGKAEGSQRPKALLCDAPGGTPSINYRPLKRLPPFRRFRRVSPLGVRALRFPGEGDLR